jgi:hypothetical protein
MIRLISLERTFERAGVIDDAIGKHAIPRGNILHQPALFGDLRVHVILDLRPRLRHAAFLIALSMIL